MDEFGEGDGRRMVQVSFNQEQAVLCYVFMPQKVLSTSTELECIPRNAFL